jgi:uncharacterized membrane protein
VITITNAIMGPERFTNELRSRRLDQINGDLKIVCGDGLYPMENETPKHRSWLIAAIIAVVFLGGGLSTEWIAADLEPKIRNYRWIAYVMGAASLIVTFILAVRTERESATNATSATSNREISIGGSANNSTNIAGDNNTIKPSKNR